MKLANKILFFVFIICSICIASCKIYRFNDASVDPRAKTVKIGFFENRARYVNPQLSSRLTDRFQQKVTQQTKLTRTNNDDAHYIIGGYISGYDVSTSGVSAQSTVTNRLAVSVHITFRNNLDNKTDEYDVTRNFDFSANLSLQQAEAQLLDNIIKNMTDEIFNRIFSNW